MIAAVAPGANATPKPSSCTLICDFDGVVAPFVANLSQARPHPDIVQAFKRLLALGVHVGLASGRSCDYLRHAFGPPLDSHLLLIGLGGAEWSLGSITRRHPFDPVMLRHVRDIAHRATELETHGVQMEDKEVILSLDHDFEPKKLGAITDFLQRWVEPNPNLRTFSAGGATEIAPNVDFSKATGIREALTLFPETHHVIFVGDDPDSDLSSGLALRTFTDLQGDPYHVTLGMVKHDRFPQKHFEDYADFTYMGIEAFARELNSLTSTRGLAS